MVSKVGMLLNVSSSDLYSNHLFYFVLNQDLALNYDLLIAVLPYLT